MQTDTTDTTKDDKPGSSMGPARAHILRNTTWGSVNILGRYVSSFLATALIAKSFSVVEFGIYQLALTYLGIFEMLSVLNGTHLRNHLARHPEHEAQVASIWSLQNFFVWLAVQCCVLIGFLAFRSEEPLFWFILSIVTLRLLFRWMDYIPVIADHRMLAAHAQKSQAIIVGGFNLSRIVVALSSASMTALSLTSVFYGIWSVIVQKRLRSIMRFEFKLSWSWALFRSFALGGAWLTAVAFLGVLQARMIAIFAAEKMSPVDYGNLQLIFKLVEPVTTLGVIVIGANYSVLAHTLQSRPEIFKKRFFKVSGLTMGVAAVTSFFIIVFPKEWFVFFFGEDYTVAANHLWMGAGIIFSTTFLNIAVTWDQLQMSYISSLRKYVILIAGYFIASTAFSSGLSIQNALLIQSAAPFLAILIDYLFVRTVSFAKQRT